MHMSDLFKAEFARFLRWALIAGATQLMVLGFLTRVVDLAQQPLMYPYLVFAAVYGLCGLLLGLLQFGGYRRPNAWLNLLHRPLPHPRIALALLGAGAALLAIAVLLPLLAVAAWQEFGTARVVDQRHLLLCLAGWGVALIGYLAGACAMLGPRRHAAAALVFLAMLMTANASGVGALLLQLALLGWLLAWVLVAFKPDLDAAPRGLLRTLIVGLPLAAALWVGLLFVGFGVEMVWIVQGSHPNNLATLQPGSAKEADNAEGSERLIAGLAGSDAAEAALWREQAAISDIAELGPDLGELPSWGELTNVMPMEFDDGTRRIRRVFSHDSGRFEGYRIADGQAVPALGVDGDGRFSSPPLPLGDGLLAGRDTVWQYDEESDVVLPRAQLPAGEVLTGLELFGERAALLSDRALYFYDARELALGADVLQPRQRVPLPGVVGNLTRVDVMELLDGYLVSFSFTRFRHNGLGSAYQTIVRVGEDGQVTPVARRPLIVGYGPVFLYQTWYVSPLVHAAHQQLTRLLAPYAPGRDLAPPPRPPLANALAIAIAVLSLIGALWHLRRTALPLPARIAWAIACLAFGLPGLLALLLMHRPIERLDDVAAPALALGAAGVAGDSR
jgi:hypothetical protein